MSPERTCIKAAGDGTAEGSYLWGLGRWQRLALLPPRGARAVGLGVIPYWGTVTGQPQRVVIVSEESTEMIELRPGWQEVEMAVPPAPGRPWLLTFRVERTGRPSELEPEGSPDQRRLAVGLRRLRWIQ